MSRVSLKALAEKALKAPSSLSAAEIRRLQSAAIRKLDRQINNSDAKLSHPPHDER